MVSGQQCQGIVTFWVQKDEVLCYHPDFLPFAPPPCWGAQQLGPWHSWLSRVGGKKLGSTAVSTWVGGKTEAQTGGWLGGAVPRGAQSDADAAKNSMMVPGCERWWNSPGASKASSASAEENFYGF